ncbi:hypothetical protein GW17_00053688 [Ensete ventricosum]|nr:hypothetical protein GW17_00053688 [Ensete ventricosum]
MEGVEEANREALESCHRVLSLLSETQDRALAYKDLMADTGKAVSRFNMVISMLSNGVGHARPRRLNDTQQLHFNHGIFLDSPAVSRADQSPLLLQLLPGNPLQKGVNEFGSTADIPSQTLAGRDAASWITPQAALSNPTLTHLHFLQQQHSSQMFQLKLQSAMCGRSNSGMNLKFDNSSCTATVSSSRSFLSSLSMDGSMDGKAFNLIGGSQLPNPMSWQLHNRRRCTGGGEDGNGKCGRTGRCHCSKKRLDIR